MKCPIPSNFLKKKGDGIQTLADTEVLEMYHNVLLEDVFSQYMAHAPFVREFFSAYTKKT
jgi:hypothetical protein